MTEAPTRERAAQDSPNKAWLRALELTGSLAKTPDRLLAVCVEAHARVNPDAPALLSDAGTLTYADLAARARRWSRWAIAHRIERGQAVALIAPNSPEYMAIWLGLSRVGVVTALINTNLKGQGLAHCLAAASPRRVLVAPAFAAVLEEALAGADANPAMDRPAIDRLDEPLEAELAALRGSELAGCETRGVTLRDTALLIYTSGTTGLPKAARVSHHRIMSWSAWFSGLLGAGPDDRLYDCLPMYHSVGGVVATGALLFAGGSVAVAERFSASRFWDDVARFDCTLFQYIGELCRYLVKAPAHPRERAHRLRAACGNGLRPDIWEAFQSRFAIPRILEFYAATEGTFSLFNVEGEPGAIGRVPGFMAHRFPAAIVRHDPDTGAPARGPDGFCIRCARGEAGEAIGRISAPGGDPAHRFEGYTDAAETEKKVLRDVFEAGDAWMRTGDLMRIDARGFFHFVDRVGDTFRWKGENVSTGEVTAAVAACEGVEAAAVYGVAVPGADGRAGMAAVVAGDGFDLDALRARLADALPAYARPLFIRLTPSLSVTETFKQRTVEFARDGFDPSRIQDPIYFDDPRAGRYVRLDAAAHGAITRGEVRL